MATYQCKKPSSKGPLTLEDGRVYTYNQTFDAPATIDGVAFPALSGSDLLELNDGEGNVAGHGYILYVTGEVGPEPRQVVRLNVDKTTTEVWDADADPDTDDPIIALDSVASRTEFPQGLVNPDGLDRHFAALANADDTEHHICCVGDSRTFGQWYNGTATVLADATTSVYSWVAILRGLFADEFGDTGEGFIFPSDDRMTSGGGLVTGLYSGPSVLRNNRRFTSASNTLTFTVPSGVGITRAQVIQANGSAGTEGTVPGTGGAVNAQITYTVNGGGSQNLAAPTNTGVPFTSSIACTGGDVIVVSGPASGQNTILGVVFRTAQTDGVVVHRMGRPGYTSPNMFGGVYNGTLGTPNGTNVLSAGQRRQCIRSLYQWTGDAAPLVILAWGTNEVTKQDQSTGIDCGVTPGLFRATLEAVVKQVAADGGCTLLVSPSPSPAENTSLGAAPLSSYAAMAYDVAISNEHCAMLDMASRDEWFNGGFATIEAGAPVPVSDTAKATAVAAAATALLRDPGSSHETPAGYEQNGEILYEVLS